MEPSSLDKELYTVTMDWSQRGLELNADGTLRVSDNKEIDDRVTQFFKEAANDSHFQEMVKGLNPNEQRILRRNLIHLAQEPKGKILKTDIFTLDRLFSPDDSVSTDIGNKAKNTVILDDFLVDAQVPTYECILNVDIQNYLRESGFDLEAEWDEFRTLQEGYHELTPEAVAKLKDIRNSIKKLFSDKSYSSPALEAFFTKLSDSDIVMVRSTGKEDSSTSANAGGNKTLPSRVDSKEISTTIGLVIASYFDQKSLQQRLLAGDDILESPFVPVMLQKNIGELITSATPSTQDVNKIPVSFVMYTSEAEGGAKGLMQVQASYGHGEGVVNSLVGLDSYYLYEDGVAHKVIATKTERMACFVEEVDGKIKTTIQATSNSTEIAKRPCLDNEALEALKRVSELIEAHYGCPTDVEGVYLPETKQVYIVQARPLVAKQEGIPSYSHLNQPSVKGRLIGEGKGEVKLAEGKGSVIFAETLDGALKTYLSSIDNRDIVQSVIVKQMAGSTSHAATTFRQEKMPVLCVANKEGLQNHLESGGQLLIDPQRSHIYPLSGEKTSLEELKEKEIIVEGRINYPLPLEQTLSKPEWQQLQSDLNTFIVLAQQSPKWQAIHKLTLSEKMERITDPEWADQIPIIVASIEKSLIDTVNIYGSQSVAAMPLLNALVSLKEVQDAAREKVQLKVLVAKRWLQTALYQENNRSVVGSESFKQYLEEISAERKINEIWRKEVPALEVRSDMSENEAKEFFVQYMKASKTALRPELAEQWELFTLTIAKSKSRKLNQLLSQALKIAQERGIMPEFMQLVFQSAWESSKGNVIRCLANIDEEMSNALESVQSFTKITNAIDKWEGKISSWAHEERFDNLWKAFSTDINEILQDASWGKLISDPNAPHLAKTMALKAIEKLTTIYDHTIKSFEGSCRQNDNNAKRFWTMVGPYHELMRTMVRLIPQTTYDSWLEKIDDSREDSMREPMLATISDAYQSLGINPSSAQFRPGAVSINNVKIGSGANFGRGFRLRDVTIESFFSLAHQNILQSISVLQNEYGLKPDHLPDPVKTLVNTLTEPYALSISDTTTPNILSVVTSEFPLIKIPLNISVRNHSCSVEITYNANTKESEVKVNLLGQPRADRLFISCLYGFFSGLAKGFSFTTLPHRPDSMSAEVTWKWSAKNYGEEILAKEIIQTMINGTYNSSLIGYEKFESTILASDPQAAIRLQNAIVEYGDPLYENLFNRDTFRYLATPSKTMCDFLSYFDEKKWIDHISNYLEIISINPKRICTWIGSEFKENNLSIEGCIAKYSPVLSKSNIFSGQFFQAMLEEKNIPNMLKLLLTNYIEKDTEITLTNSVVEKVLANKDDGIFSKVLEQAVQKGARIVCETSSYSQGIELISKYPKLIQVLHSQNLLHWMSELYRENKVTEAAYMETVSRLLGDNLNDLRNFMTTQFLSDSMKWRLIDMYYDKIQFSVDAIGSLNLELPESMIQCALEDEQHEAAFSKLIEIAVDQNVKLDLDYQSSLPSVLNLMRKKPEFLEVMDKEQFIHFASKLLREGKIDREEFVLFYSRAGVNDGLSLLDYLMDEISIPKDIRWQILLDDPHYVFAQLDTFKIFNSMLSLSTDEKLKHFVSLFLNKAADQQVYVYYTNDYNSTPDSNPFLKDYGKDIEYIKLDCINLNARSNTELWLKQIPNIKGLQAENYFDLKALTRSIEAQELPHLKTIDLTKLSEKGSVKQSFKDQMALRGIEVLI